MGPPVDVTHDGFHRGRFVLVQPAAGAHRAGMDAMLLAACVPDGFAGRLADLGAGAGAAGLAVLSRCADARAVLVERDATMAACARQTLSLNDNAALADRCTIIETDLTADGAARDKAGLHPDTFDAVIANPPFNDHRDRQSPHSMKAGAHVANDEMLQSWLRTSAAIGKPGAIFAIILRPTSLSALMAACQNRFGALALTPVLPRADQQAIRILVTGKKGSRAPLTITPPVILHQDAETAFTPQADLLINGLASLR